MKATSDSSLFLSWGGQEFPKSLTQKREKPSEPDHASILILPLGFQNRKTQQQQEQPFCSVEWLMRHSLLSVVF